ncbi:Meiotic nuclear division protein 1 [Physocladia obscura]|uniref:Meiotic nuclear division protein 1 n=1 Tax=Physocladia obscura TaxID=109957 RepID=A0AAD5SPI3_9FUNG|nr:Meiotic nuclear division protein 1 [Physocladia obscura]
MKEELEKAKKRKEDLHVEIAAARIGRDESDERKELIERVTEIESALTNIKGELAEYKDCDPILIEAKEKAAEVAKQAANRWTDNIFCLQSFCSNKFTIEKSVFNKQFGISDDLDNLE